MKTKKIIINLFNILLITLLSTIAYSKDHNTFTSIHGGIVEYTELIDGDINGVTIDFNSGKIQYSFESIDKSTHAYEISFDLKDINLTPELKSFNFDYSSYSNQVFFGDHQTKGGEMGCAQQAGKLFDLATQMIKEGKATDNSLLVAFGTILKNMAINMIQACITAP